MDSIPAKKLLDQVALVRGVDCVPFKSEAHEQRVGAEDVPHVRKNADAAASTARNRFDTIYFRHCFGCRLIS